MRLRKSLCRLLRKCTKLLGTKQLQPVLLEMLKLVKQTNQQQEQYLLELLLKLLIPKVNSILSNLNLQLILPSILLLAITTTTLRIFVVLTTRHI